MTQLLLSYVNIAPTTILIHPGVSVSWLLLLVRLVQPVVLQNLVPPHHHPFHPSPSRVLYCHPGSHFRLVRPPYGLVPSYHLPDLEEDEDEDFDPSCTSTLCTSAHTQASWTRHWMVFPSHCICTWSWIPTPPFSFSWEGCSSLPRYRLCWCCTVEVTIDSGIVLSIRIDNLGVFINKTLSTESLINQLLIKRDFLSISIDSR